MNAYLRKFGIGMIMAMLLPGIAVAAEKPWSHGKLKVTEGSRFFSHKDGTPFFWMGDTGWLLPQRTDRDEAANYLARAAEAGFNVVQVQVLNGVPSFNRYGAMSNPDGWNFDNIDKPGEYGYWDHLDYIVDQAARQGIYIGMVCIWGGLVKGGLLSEEDAVKYGKFLADRYKDKPNIVWIIGGDIQGDVKTEVWDALARSIKANDPNHLMSFHPRGRHTSAQWFADREWIDFHSYQSGHRRNGQRGADKTYPIPDGTEECCWQFADTTFRLAPNRPVIDSEPSYEAIPKGLHSPDEQLWTAKEVRRYAWWDVMAGCAGHTYGHNAVMQFARPGLEGAYFLDTDKLPWWKAQRDEGYQSMRHLRSLMESVPYWTGVPDDNTKTKSIEYENPSGDAFADRIASTRGEGYAMHYLFNPAPVRVRMPFEKARVRWMDAASGEFTEMGTHSGTVVLTPPAKSDGVLVISE